MLLQVVARPRVSVWPVVPAGPRERIRQQRPALGDLQPVSVPGWLRYWIAAWVPVAALRSVLPLALARLAAAQDGLPVLGGALVSVQLRVLAVVVRLLLVAAIPAVPVPFPPQELWGAERPRLATRAVTMA